MSGYRKLLEEWELVESETGIEGVQAYIEETAGTDTLPAIGDAFDGSNLNVLARRIRQKYTHFEAGVKKKKFVISYSSRPGSSEIITPDEDNRRYTGGGEILTIDEPLNWKWNGDNSAIDQPMFLSNVMGTFTRQRILTSDAAKETWIDEVFAEQAGTINTTAFEGHRIGSVLFTGFSGGTQFDENGDKTWVYDLEFSYRIIRSPAKEKDDGGQKFAVDYNGAAIKQDDWLFLWRDTGSAAGGGAWDKPKDGDGNFLYAKTELEDLF
jgi:hypothetical protein